MIHEPLPRPLRDSTLMSHLSQLDERRRMERKPGRLEIELHYDESGWPRSATLKWKTRRGAGTRVDVILFADCDPLARP